MQSHSKFNIQNYKRVIIQEILFGTPAFDENLRLRNDILRVPLGLEFYQEDIEKEWDSYHLGCYTSAGELMGSLIMKDVGKGQVKMRQVAVADKFQKQGVGQALVKASEDWADENNFSKIVLHAREVAVPFYHKLKYETVGERFEEVNIPHFKMVKKL